MEPEALLQRGLRKQGLKPGVFLILCGRLVAKGSKKTRIETRQPMHFPRGFIELQRGLRKQGLKQCLKMWAPASWAPLQRGLRKQGLKLKIDKVEEPSPVKVAKESKKTRIETFDSV